MRDEFNVVIDRFAGIDQSSEENLLKLSSAVSAENMETDDGTLTVAPGYVKAIQAPVPGDKRITRLMAFPHGGAPEFIAAAENDLYAYKNGVWTLIKSFTAIENDAWDYVVARIGEVDYIIIANGEYPPIKYDGETVTDLNTETVLPCVKYLAVHGERLMAAGDPDYPNRVYYSDSYALGDWGLGEVPGSGGGTIEIDPTAGDGITGLFAVFNTLLVMKNGRIWYLSGYTPGEYHVRRVFGEVDPTAHTAIVSHAETAYLLTPYGLCFYNGLSLQPHKTHGCIKTLLAGYSTADTRAAEHNNKLYFTLSAPGAGYASAIVVFDVTRQTYMLRTGFLLSDIAVAYGKLYAVGQKRFVYRWGEGQSYDGDPANAHWECPETDLGAKNVLKTSLMLYTRAVGESGSQLVIRHTFSDPRVRARVSKRLLTTNAQIIRPLVNNYGRRVKLRFENEGGKWWSLRGGAQLRLELEED